MEGSHQGRWLELSLHAADEAVDAISQAFRDCGSNGVVIEPPVISDLEEGSKAGPGLARVLAYLPCDDRAEDRTREIEKALWHLTAFELAPVSKMRRRVIDEEDWANAWKEHFHPVRIGRHMVVKPSWRDVDEKEGDVVVELDPGMAFGTGLHPTTQMMLEALEERIRPNMSVVDVGTGSGILAIASAKLGSSRVLALDVETVAVDSARENVRMNAVEPIVTVLNGSTEVASGAFDLVAANIVASVIADLVPEFQRLMHPDSILIVSGIIRERDHLVQEAFCRGGLNIVASRQSGDWLCHTARPSPA